MNMRWASSYRIVIRSAACRSMSGTSVDGLDTVVRQVTIEMNSACDNPLINPDREMDYHGGNFLGQYIGVAMDQLRYYLGLMAKHLDVQIALLSTPEFSNGLPPCLIGNIDRKVNMGFKALQISAVATRSCPFFRSTASPSSTDSRAHAEQFDRNINSLGLGSANLARQSIETFHHYMAVALMFAVQAVDLRTYLVAGHYDAPAPFCRGQRPRSMKPYARLSDAHHRLTGLTSEMTTSSPSTST